MRPFENVHNDDGSLHGRAHVTEPNLTEVCQIALGSPIKIGPLVSVQNQKYIRAMARTLLSIRITTGNENTCI